MKKSIFISVYVLAISIGVGFASFLLYRNGMSIAPMGLLITSGSAITFFLLLYTLHRRARTRANLPIYTSLLVFGLVLSFVGLLSEPMAPIVPSLSLLVAIGWFAYLKWYSQFIGRKGAFALELGQKIPPLDFVDIEGGQVSNKDIGGKYKVYIFFRGNWCPLCMTQIKEVAAMYNEFEERGAKVLFISAQPESSTRKLASEYGLQMNFLRDPNNRAALMLGIIDKNGLPLGLQVLGYDSDTVMPTILISDDHDKLLYSDLTSNYRLRPHPEEFLRVIEQAGKNEKK